ncbi:MAG: alanyl-tRNA editing protein [Actinomycetia bacterium]|nr:alanyl-tRNA editing protein [Actinomycetes bacterium]
MASETDSPPAPPTDRRYLTDAYARTLVTTVVAVDEGRVALAATVFYPTGGGQPHDTGSLTWGGGRAEVTEVRSQGPVVWHSIDGKSPALGSEVSATIDWERRYGLMRTHTALHILCGIIWNEWGKAVTGGNMNPADSAGVGSARMDFEFDPLPDDFASRVEALVAAEVAADRAIEVSTLPRDTALEDADLIRTKVNLIPESVSEIRVVDITGLDKQADGGTHVAATAEVGRVEVLKTESKGKGNKRVRIAIHPPA